MSNSRVPPRRARSFAPKETEGSLQARGLRFLVVCSRWNPTVTEALLSRALATLRDRGARPEDVEVIHVPGAFELPFAAAAAVRQGPRRPDAVIVLAAIVRGQTTHHEILASSVAGSLASLSLQDCPIGFGLLTCDTLDQALARSSKGAEAADAAVEMANLRRRLRPSKPAKLSKGGKRRANGDASYRARIEPLGLRSPGRPIVRSHEREPSTRPSPAPRGDRRVR